MADDDPLFIPFRFHVSFAREAIGAHGSAQGQQGNEPLADGGFAEVTGLEASMEPRSIREGGLNHVVHQRSGPVQFSTVVLRRGLTRARDLWQWWALIAGASSGGADDRPPGGAFAYRLTVRIRLADIDGSPAFVWRLDRALPIKFKTADLNARAAEIGVEELHLVHEGLHLEGV